MNEIKPYDPSKHMKPWETDINSKIKERFFSKIEKTDTCWIWNSVRLTGNYGYFKYLGKYVRAHRMSYILANGHIPDNLLVLHTCDNPPCVNPEHLYLGTQKDNIKDKFDRGRNPNVNGSKNPVSKLSENEVLKIRELNKEKYSNEIIAKMFSIDSSAVSLIINRKRWKHI